VKKSNSLAYNLGFSSVFGSGRGGKKSQRVKSGRIWLRKKKGSLISWKSLGQKGSKRRNKSKLKEM